MAGFKDYLRMILGWWNGSTSVVEIEPPACSDYINLLTESNDYLNLLTASDDYLNLQTESSDYIDLTC